DAIDTKFKYKGHEITLIDTAGIRRKSKVDYGIEAFSVVRSLRAISRADVVALILDVSQPISDQDQKIGGKIEDAGKPVVLVLNKWDLIPDRSSQQMNDLIEETKRELRHLHYAEIVFTSAHTKQRLPKIIEAADRALQESTRRISTSLINQVINEAVAITPPPASKRGTRLKVYYSTQVSVLPPTFVLFVNDNKLLTDNYRTYLERRIREAFGFSGTPIRLITRPKERK
ncbi:MAG: GTP-binding protein, partial [Candidatus Obscuribacterales bacterium]|nr:GTP-binding protein [Candidatus Obscuribacterales bacterium]